MRNRENVTRKYILIENVKPNFINYQDQKILWSTLGRFCTLVGPLCKCMVLIDVVYRNNRLSIKRKDCL